LGFMKRFNLALRRRTRISQKLPDKTQEQLEKFHQFVKNLKIEKSFELGNILNMDETPVWFDMAGVYTINPKGEKTVHIRATGNEKNRFTVVLTCAAGTIFSNFSSFFNSVFFNLLIIILLFKFHNAVDGSKFPLSASSKAKECHAEKERLQESSFGSNKMVGWTLI